MPEQERVGLQSRPNSRVLEILRNQGNPTKREAMKLAASGQVLTLVEYRGLNGASRSNASKAVEQIVSAGLFLEASGGQLYSTVLGDEAVRAYDVFTKGLIDPFFRERVERLQEVGDDFKDLTEAVKRQRVIAMESQTAPIGIHTSLAVISARGVVDFMSALPVPDEKGLSIPEAVRWLERETGQKLALSFGEDVFGKLKTELMVKSKDRLHSLTDFGVATLSGFDRYQEALLPLINKSVEV